MSGQTCLGNKQLTFYCLFNFRSLHAFARYKNLRQRIPLTMVLQYEMGRPAINADAVHNYVGRVQREKHK